jgi:hypothetical protein
MGEFPRIYNYVIFQSNTALEDMHIDKDMLAIIQFLH